MLLHISLHIFITRRMGVNTFWICHIGMLGSFLVVLTILDSSVLSAVEHCDMSVDDDAELGNISLFARVVALSRLLELVLRRSSHNSRRVMVSSGSCTCLVARDSQLPTQDTAPITSAKCSLVDMCFCSLS